MRKAKVPDDLNVYTVDLYHEALEWIRKEDNISQVLIGSDSLSVMYSLRTDMSNGCQDLLYEILTTYTRVKDKCDEIPLIWTPAHVGISHPHEGVDTLAKQTIKNESTEVNIKMSMTEGKSTVWEEAGMVTQENNPEGGGNAMLVDASRG